jgi:hypothetical protein|tara:strand:- start:93 stop:419 length:327 start_codon:yes stop_codon:yes gene_type:complete
MSVTSQLEKAEEAIRQALINALAEGEDEYLTELFVELNSVRELRKKVSNTIRFADNTDEYYKKLEDPLKSDYSIDLIDFGHTRKDLDAIDNVIDFPIKFGDDNPGLTD